MLKELRGSDVIIECLLEQGVDTVFGYPGGAVLNIYDSLYKYSDKIHHVITAHEQAACHAADGYSRTTGRTGVVIATSGPGATNLVTGIATAYMDSIPMVAITGNVTRDLLGLDSFQEVDICGITMPITKHNYIVKDPAELADIIREAFYIANEGRKGPVLIDIPMDVQKAVIDFEYPEKCEIRSYKPTTKGNYVQVRRVMAALEEAEKPLICIGGGVFAAHAENEIRELADLMQIPVITTMMGISVFPDDDQLFCGMIGTHGVKMANAAVNECDVLFLVGARVGDRAVKTPLALEKTTKIIHIDIDPAEIGKNIGADLPLVGDAKLVLQQMTELVKPMKHDEWIAHIKTLGGERKYVEPAKGTVNPRVFIDRLAKKMPANVTVVADVGQNQIWTCTEYKFRKEGRLLTSGGMGTMGYSVPAAIGAKMADNSRATVAICGDGAFQMSFMELATAVQFGVDIKVVVMTNDRLGMVRELQTNGYHDRQTAVFLDGSPDFIKLAEAYGIPAMRVYDDDTMEKGVEMLAEHKGICLVEVVVDKDMPTL